MIRSAARGSIVGALESGLVGLVIFIVSRRIAAL
jgi:hypothetical protein